MQAPYPNDITYIRLAIGPMLVIISSAQEFGVIKYLARNISESLSATRGPWSWVAHATQT